MKKCLTNCEEYPYLWESDKSYGLNKDVTLEYYDIDNRLNDYQKNYPMINLEINDYYQLGGVDIESLYYNNPRYELKLWWLGDSDEIYSSNSKSVIKSMFYQAVKFLHKKLNKPNLTKEDVSQAYDDCAEMLDKRHTIEYKRSYLQFRDNDMSKRLKSFFRSSIDLRKNKRKWTDKQISQMPSVEELKKMEMGVILRKYKG